MKAWLEQENGVKNWLQIFLTIFWWKFVTKRNLICPAVSHATRKEENNKNIFCGLPEKTQIV